MNTYHHSATYATKSATALSETRPASLLQIRVVGATGYAQAILADLATRVRPLLGADIRPSFAPPRAGDVRLSQADITRARADLGYDPKVPFRDGLARTLAAYRGQ